MIVPIARVVLKYNLAANKISNFIFQKNIPYLLLIGCWVDWWIGSIAAAELEARLYFCLLQQTNLLLLENI